MSPRTSFEVGRFVLAADTPAANLHPARGGSKVGLGRRRRGRTRR